MWIDVVLIFLILVIAFFSTYYENSRESFGSLKEKQVDFLVSFIFNFFVFFTAYLTIGFSIREVFMFVSMVIIFSVLFRISMIFWPSFGEEIVDDSGFEFDELVVIMIICMIISCLITLLASYLFEGFVTKIISIF